MVKLSIIISYYNTYDYTIKLLRELRIQKTDDIEIILVDDGCHETRFDEFSDIATIIHLEENGGFAHALNEGMKKVKGKYVGFIDSDDMITMDYVDVLLKTVDERDEDIIFFNWVDLGENYIVQRPSNYAIWKAIYKKEIIPKFHEDVKYCADVPFQEDLAKVEHSKFYIDRVLYLYNSNREGSLTWERLHLEEGK